MNPTRTHLAERLHDSPLHGVLAVTGGGSAAISGLLTTPGASATVLEAVAPYARPALDQWLGGEIDSACSDATARAMAVAAMQRARRLAGVGEFDALGDAGRHLFGLGCTASLASNRPKRGPHRVHVAVQTVGATGCWSLVLDKGARTRLQEEALAADLVLHALAGAAGVGDAPFSVAPGDRLTACEQPAPPLWRETLWGDTPAARIDPSADRHAHAGRPDGDFALMPGSFNPPHRGHRRMVEAARRLLGKPVELEISITNADKPRLDYLALEERLAAIAEALPGAHVWLTRTPTFHEKSARFRGCTFVVGADTIRRIADPRYYGGDPAARDAAITTLAERGCGFLVFGRLADGRFESLPDLPLPAALRPLCVGVPEDQFRVDISSTELRGAAE